MEMTSADGVTARTSGTGTAAASASQRRPFRLGRERRRYRTVLLATAARGGEGRGGSGEGGLGERAAPARKGDHEVLVAVLRADDSRLPDG
jgi:hypothetical protein